MVVVKIQKLHKNAVIPSYAKNGDAGLDLTAIAQFTDEYGNICYNTGLAVEIPDGFEGQLRPRSSITKYDLALANSPATIDSGYRGELIVKFKRALQAPQDKLAYRELKIYGVGERICQLVINELPKVQLVEVEELSQSERGNGGFGSSGK